MKAPWLASAGSLASALGASSCCVLPAILIGGGVSSAGLATTLEQFRPAFIVLSLGLLAVGFYLNYFRTQACAEGDGCAPKASRTRTINRTMLWISTPVVLALMFAPAQVQALFGSTPVGGDAATGAACCSAETADTHAASCGTGSGCSVPSPTAATTTAAGSCGGCDATAGAPNATPVNWEGTEVTVLDESLQPLLDRFHADQDKPRIVALLSPSCGGCVYEADAIRREVLEAFPEEDLSVLLVWEPMLPSDSEATAYSISKSFDDPRVAQFWDPGRTSGSAYSREVFPRWLQEMAGTMPEDHEMAGYCRGLAGKPSDQAPMWDIALFYPPGAEWSDGSVAWSKQIAFYGEQEDGTSGTFYRDRFDARPIESDWFLEVGDQMQRLLKDTGSLLASHTQPARP